MSRKCNSYTGRWYLLHRPTYLARLNESSSRPLLSVCWSTCLIARKDWHFRHTTQAMLNQAVMNAQAPSEAESYCGLFNFDVKFSHLRPRVEVGPIWFITHQVVIIQLFDQLLPVGLVIVYSIVSHLSYISLDPLTSRRYMQGSWRKQQIQDWTTNRVLC